MVDSVYLELLADWYPYFILIGLASFAVFWYMGVSLFGGKLIVVPFFFFVMSMFGFLARKQHSEVYGA